MKIVGIALALAFLATATQDVAAQSRTYTRCPNGGTINGKYYCDVTKVTQGSSSSTTGTTKKKN